MPERQVKSMLRHGSADRAAAPIDLDVHQKLRQFLSRLAALPYPEATSGKPARDL